MQSAQAHAKFADYAMSDRDAKCTDARGMRGLQFNCKGRIECAGRNCVERCGSHCPHTSLAPAMQCQCNASKFHITSWHQNVPGWWNSHTTSIMTVDDLGMQGARTSAAMVLTWLGHTMPVSSQEGLMWWFIQSTIYSHWNMKCFISCNRQTKLGN